MTTELKQEFFKVFGIEPIPIKSYGNWLIKGSITENDKGEKVVYPEISDRKLLQMICILNDHEGIDVQGTTIKELKEELLIQCIEYFKYPIAFEENADLCNLHNKIQQLFKENQ